MSFLKNTSANNKKKKPLKRFFEECFQRLDMPDGKHTQALAAAYIRTTPSNLCKILNGDKPHLKTEELIPICLFLELDAEQSRFLLACAGRALVPGSEEERVYCGVINLYASYEYKRIKRHLLYGRNPQKFLEDADSYIKKENQLLKATGRQVPPLSRENLE